MRNVGRDSRAMHTLQARLKSTRFTSTCLATLLCLTLMSCSRTETLAESTTQRDNATTLVTAHDTINVTQPPIAARKPHSFTHHGITIEDPYAWLRDSGYPEVNDAEILAHLEAENRHYEAHMAPLATLTDNIFTEIKARQLEDDQSVPYFKNGYWYQWRYEGGAQYRRWLRAAASDDTDTPSANDWTLMLDENALAKDQKFFRLGALTVSPDGRKLAYSTDTDGSERYTLKIVDLKTGQVLENTIKNTIGGVEWASDSASFLYTVVSPEWRPYQVYHHVLHPSDSPSEGLKQDSSAPSDRLVYEEQDTSFFVGLERSQSEEYIFIASGSHTTNEVHMLHGDNLDAPPVLIAPRISQQEYDLDHQGEHFVIRSNRRHPNFDLYRTPTTNPTPEHWQLWVEGDEEHYLTGHLALSNHVILTERVNGLDQIRVIPNSGESHYIEFPEAAYEAELGVNPSFDVQSIRINYNSMVTPNTVSQYDLVSQDRKVLKVQQIPSGYDPSQFETIRLMAPARDGAYVPVSLVKHKDTPIDGSAPLYLYGYGAYGLAMSPSFSTSRISLLERGFIYAIAHIRGGDELGYEWYTAGKLNKRTNTFNDFVDVAQHLIEERYASAKKLGIAGGSAGGKLMGAVVNQAPELWGAVASHVPFVDVLNTILDETLPLTPIEWDEWGNPITDAEAFNFIRSYSPYDQLEPGEYPPMMVTAGINDPRVTYWEPAKYVAKLRHLKTDSNALIFKINMGAGHGGKSGRYDSLRETAEEFAFMVDVLGKPNEKDLNEPSS